MTLITISQNMNLLQEIFPYLARQVVEDYGITRGICLDIGSGDGNFGLEIAEITALTVYLVDKDANALSNGRRRAEERSLGDQIQTVETDVHDMELPDNFADLIVSRGSIWFWRDRSQGLREIYRVLKKGGVAMVGGGLGRKLPAKYRIPRAREREKRKKDPDWMYIRSEEYFRKILSEAGIETYRLNFDAPVGRWAEINK